MLRTSFLLCVYLIMQMPVGVTATIHQVDMVNFAFVPETLIIFQGDTVLWVNQGSVSHTSTSGTDGVPDGVWDSGFISPGDSFAFAFDTLSGSYPYFCTPHWNFGMVGMIFSMATGIQDLNPGAHFQCASSLPNPFSAAVELGFNVMTAGPVEIRIFNSLGQPVRQLRYACARPGYCSISWDGENDNGVRVRPGVYLAVFNSGKDVMHVKLIYSGK